MKKYLFTIPIAISQVVAASLMGSYSLDAQSSGSAWYTRATLGNSGNYLYLSNGYSGFSTLDIRDVSNIKEVSNIKDEYPSYATTNVTSLKLSNDGKFLYVGTADIVLVYDMTDKLNPKYVTSYDINFKSNTNDYATDFEFSPNSKYVYVAVYNKDIAVFDANHENSQYLSRAEPSGYISSLKVDKDKSRLYVGHKTGFDVFDISNQKEPNLSQNISFNSSDIDNFRARDIEIIDGYIIVAAGQYKSAIIFYDDETFEEVARYDLKYGDIDELSLSKDKTKLYISNRGESIILDISNLNNLKEVDIIAQSANGNLAILPSLDGSKVFSVEVSKDDTNYAPKVFVYDLSKEIFSLNLNSGWQLASFPGTLNVDISKNKYISNLYSYNNKSWSSSVDDIALGGGVWIKSTKSTNVEVDLSEYSDNTFTYELEAGWNLKGSLFNFNVTDLNKECVSDLLFYDQNQGWLKRSDIVVTKKNQGFWVYASEDCNITVTKSDVGGDINEVNNFNTKGDLNEDVTIDLNILDYCKEIKFSDSTCQVYLQYSDLDGDGLNDAKELEYKSSSILVDSDGDGVSDYDEVYSGVNSYNPVIANVPEFTISALENFNIQLWTTGSEGESVSLQESEDYSKSISESISKGGSKSSTNTESHTASVTVSVEHEFGPTGGTSVGLSLGYSYTNETSKTKETNWDKTSTQDASKSVGNSKTNEYSKSTSYDGAKVLGTFTITNLTPELEYDIEGLSFNVYIEDKYGNKSLVTTLYPVDDTYTLGGGDLVSKKLSVTHKEDLINLSKAYEMLEDPDSIVIESNYNQMNINGNPISTSVENRTVDVIIDYFESPISDEYFYNGFRNSYPISKVDYDEEKKSFTLKFKTIKEVLEAYPYNYKFITSNQRIYKCRDSKESEWKDCRETKVQSKFDVCLDGATSRVCEEGEIPTKSFETLIQIQNDRMKNPNILDNWIIASDDIEKSELCDYFYPCMDFSDMNINSIGGKVAFYNYKDSDSDGIEDRIELKFGSSQYNNDSDGDGIDDFTEIAIFKTNVRSSTNYEYISSPARSWEDAKIYAESKGGRLLVINSEDELNEVLTSLNISDGNSSWIGGYNRENNLSEGWKWLDGSEFSYSNWSENEPNIIGNNKCIEMQTSGKWSDSECSNERGFIIEYGNSEKSGFSYEDPYLDTDEDGLYDVDEKYIYFTDSKKADTDGDGISDGKEVNEFFTNPLSAINYELIDNVSVDYETAKTLAESRGGKLLVVNSEDELEAIKTELGITVLSKNTWIGADTGSCIALTPDFTYYNASCSSATHFIVEYGVNSSRVEVDSDDSDGDGLVDILEELQGTNILNPDSDGDGLSDGEEVNKYGTNPLIKDSDDDGLSDFKEVMYFGTDPNRKVNYEIVTDVLSWEVARDRAIAKGGHLLVINSDEEKDYIVEQLNIENVNYWIGLSKDAGESRYTGWDWVDKSEFRYTNWRYNKPDSDSQNCVMMRGSDREWDDKECTDVYPYIIEYGDKAVMKPNGVKVYQGTSTDSKFTLFGPKSTIDTFKTHATMLSDNDTGYVYGVSRDGSEISALEGAGYTYYYEESNLDDCGGRYCDGFNNNIDRFKVMGDCYVMFTDRWIDRTDGNSVMLVGPGGYSNDLSSNYFFDGNGNSSKVNMSFSFQNRIEGVAVYCKEPYSK